MVFLLTVGSLYAQAQTPLILNGDFEQMAVQPTSWNMSKADFDQTLIGWTSPSRGSPDVYDPAIRIPHKWRSLGFGGIKPIDGERFVGITVYGCKGGKTHCREYLQAPLQEPLVPGQKYALTLLVTPLPQGLRIANIGMALTDRPLHLDTDEVIDLSPMAEVSRIIDTRPGRWASVKLLFRAKARARYMILGNFNTDEHTLVKSIPRKTELGFAYYYLDQVGLSKIPPIITYADTTNTYIGRTYEVDEPVVLEHVYFDHDASTFRPESYQTLAHLLELLQRYPAMRIHLQGHTDADGSTGYNKLLAMRRARAVYDYLIEQRIASDRLSYEGHGELRPIADNQSEVGKAKNRRVEFVVKEQ